jgi:hypothetical protein
MTATRAEVAVRLHEIAEAIAADESVPLPAPHWGLVFPAGHPAGLAAAARSLGIKDGELRRNQEESGEWLQLRSAAGGVAVEVTAAAGPVLPDPLTAAGVIRRTYLGVTR